MLSPSLFLIKEGYSIGYDLLVTIPHSLVYACSRSNDIYDPRTAIHSLPVDSIQAHHRAL
jgi:hypothetical protein